MRGKIVWVISLRVSRIEELLLAPNRTWNRDPRHIGGPIRTEARVRPDILSTLVLPVIHELTKESISGAHFDKATVGNNDHASLASS